jgi:hypothetical protein
MTIPFTDIRFVKDETERRHGLARLRRRGPASSLEVISRASRRARRAEMPVD